MTVIDTKAAVAIRFVTLSIAENFVVAYSQVTKL